MHPAVSRGVLRKLAGKLGRPVGDHVEIVSTALNSLRRRGIAHYSPRGRLVLDMRALDACAAPAIDSVFR